MSDSAELELPPRYEPVRRLGRGGGGEVWAVRDRATGRSYALKLLAEEASEREMAALVREAVALSGLEGLGVPRVIRFGRLPGTNRPYLVREIVEGESLEAVLTRGVDPRAALEILARAADQLTVLHRAGLLHGDVKPANLIVEPAGTVAFVDLGLAAPWREGGSLAEGLTPRYAAPELFEGKPITVRAEVFALGVVLSEIVETAGTRLDNQIAEKLGAVAERAMAREPAERHPSVDELASEIRRELGVPAQEAGDASAGVLWPISGIDAVSNQLLEAAQALAAGSVLRLEGPPGSGCSALIRRLAWWLGVLGRPVAWIDDASSSGTVIGELSAHTSLGDSWVLVDDADGLDDPGHAAVQAALAVGARLIAVGGSRFEAARVFSIPPLAEPVCLELVRRVVPSLTAGLQRRLVQLAEGRPGALRRLVRLIAAEAVASAADFDRVVGNAPPSEASVPDRPLERAVYYLDRGRFNDAAAALSSVPGRELKASVPLSIAKARLELGVGEERQAFERLDELAKGSKGTPAERREIELFRARASIGLGDYTGAASALQAASRETDPIGIEALTYHSLAQSLLGNHDQARQELLQAIEHAQAQKLWRLEALAQASLGFVLQRADRSDEARDTYRTALASAERAGDAGLLATVQSNLAGLLKMRDDIAGSIEMYEAAVDMGRRSGRRATARQALLNLANNDLYLGRLSRAQSSIEALREQSAQLPKNMLAQLYGLEGDLLGAQGRHAAAAETLKACSEAFGELGRGLDAAEASLWSVLAGARAPHPKVADLQQALERAEALLKDDPAHKPLLLLAQGRVASLSGDEASAREKLDASVDVARSTQRREWLWPALEARAELEEQGGQPLLARRDREEALAVLEAIGARLPRDLREVYWNDPRRKSLRSSVSGAVAHAATEFLPFAPLSALPAASPTLNTARRTSGTTSSMSQMGGLTPLEQRLARILEVNSDLAGELDVERLTSKIIGHAVELLRAERGFVLLSEADGTLSVYAARGIGGDASHAEFSRSIAEGVVATREPVVTLDARGDARLKSFASVHQLLLESVACVPILAPNGAAIGALYLETRVRPGRHFERELPTLRAFADQAAIALENARLVRQNKERADELANTNAELAEAQERLRELLDGRTEQLKRTRQKLRDARETLYSHFGYQGLVGTSGAMRKVYALVDRVKATDVPVLITGESGTGKEVVARAIHNASARGKAKMLGVNCGAIPENLLESELFGHVRGAFTGADRERKGLIREAEGGSILLDEIGEMPVKMQAGLLRVLQDKRVRPVGGTEEELVDVRILFATNRELERMVQEGKFREDLYYRIHVVEIHLPALRERLDDVPQLVDYFLGIFAARYKRDKKSVSRDALRRLQSYGWPGNVRQLEHVLLNAWVMSEDQELLAEDFELPDGFRPAAERSSTSVMRPPKKATTSQHRRDERERIIEALRSCNWNRVKAAELSGIPRRTFYRRLREYGIQ
ncbi:MAG TPA: sigma 54-interacting transcriptional regulator [Polyangiaceae bacterium]|nr:sigma 54-interacting transcriptional regulator [Polyangiaceae bacterium]